MSKPRNFSGLFKRVSKIALAEPLPPYPQLPLGKATLSKKQRDSLTTGNSEFGYPIAETFLEPAVIRLLMHFDSKRKYGHCLKSKFLTVLKAFEESADVPANYSITISEIINHPEIPVSTPASAQALARELKSFINHYLGLEFEKNVRQVRFVTATDLAEMRFYHDRNLIKTGTRAHQYWNAAYTRAVLGDEENGVVPAGIEKSVEEGVTAYAVRYLGRPDTRTYAPIALGTVERHLL